MKPQNQSRNREIYNRYMAGGISLASIGRDYEITRERVRQICKKEDPDFQIKMKAMKEKIRVQRIAKARSLARIKRDILKLERELSWICKHCGEALGDHNQSPSWRLGGSRSTRLCRPCHYRRIEKRHVGKVCEWRGCDRIRKRAKLCDMHVLRMCGQSQLPMNAPYRFRVNSCPDPVTSNIEMSRWVQYRLTPSQWKQMVEDQNGLCACCFEREATEVDYHHAPGTDPIPPKDVRRVRGAVCHRCNTIIGKYETETYRPLKNPHLIQLVETYLEKERPFT